MTIEHRLASNAVEIGFERQVCAPRCLCDLRRQFALLCKARHGRLDRAPRNLRGFVEIEGHILGAEDLLDALLIVEPAYPDLRTVGQFEVEVGLVEPRAQGRKAQLQNLGQRVSPNRSFRVVEAEAEYRVPAVWRVYRPLDDGAAQQEGLARTRAATEHDVARGAGE